jgi:hypothetical protein
MSCRPVRATVAWGLLLHSTLPSSLTLVLGFGSAGLPGRPVGDSATNPYRQVSPKFR